MTIIRQAATTAAAVACAAALLAAQAPAATSAQSGMSQQQINEEMLKELRQIRQLLERLTQPQPSAPPMPTTGRVTSLKGYTMGSADAPLTMIEFTDLQCPFCRQYASTSFEEIKKTGSTPVSCGTSVGIFRSISTRRRCPRHGPPGAAGNRAGSGRCAWR